MNPADTYRRSGDFSFAGIPRELPYTPGFEGAGIIVEIGPPSKSPSPPFKVGDRVYFFGAPSYAEYSSVNISNLFPLPDSLTFEQGAAIPVAYGTAVRALFQTASLKPGEIVLVSGASGGVGIAACQVASSLGCRVIGTAGTEEGLEIVRRVGRAEKVFNHRRVGYEKEIQAAVNEMRGNSDGGADVILEMLANVNLEKDLRLIGRRGRIVIVGNRGRVEIDPRDLMGKESLVAGVMLPGATEEEFAELWARIGAGVRDGVFVPLVGKKFKLEEAAKAHEELIDPKEATKGKMVLVIE